MKHEQPSRILATNLTNQVPRTSTSNIFTYETPAWVQ